MSVWIAVALLAVPTFVLYWGALDVPFISDDTGAIVTNASIHQLWPLLGTSEQPGPLRPPVAFPTAGRPLVNLSFALNYYFGGLAPTGYHAVNALLHFCSALFLGGIVKRTLRLPYFAGRFDSAADWLALAVALLWALHPLQTEAVIYATQRTELMMAFFYLATLYCSLRYWLAGTVNPRLRTLWPVLAVLASLCGMASKEVMVSAPLLVLLYERTFIAGSLAGALRRSWPLYVGLAFSWLLLLGLNISGPRGDTAGFGEGPSLFTWWLTQSQVLWMYLKLIVWPHPMLIHYELPYLTTLGETWMYVVPILLTGGVTLVLLWRNDPVGYLLTWVFVILSPTTLVPIPTEVAAERRMYLPLAAFAVLLVVSGFRLVQSISGRLENSGKSPVHTKLPSVLTLFAAGLMALGFGLVSFHRLRAYDDPIGLWSDVVRFQPDNSLAHSQLGGLLADAGRQGEAIDELKAAVLLKQDNFHALCSLGQALTDAGQLPEAIDMLNRAVANDPNSPLAHNNLGVALTHAGRFSEAIGQLERAVQIKPDYGKARSNLGAALAALGKTPDAISQFRLALQYNPDEANAHHSLGMLLAMSGEKAEGASHLQSAIRLRPEFADAHTALGQVFQQTGRLPEAIEQYEAAQRLQPDSWQSHANLAQALVLADRSKDVARAAEKAIEVARRGGDEAGAQQVEEWLKHYQTELRRTAEAASSGSTQAQEPARTP